MKTKNIFIQLFLTLIPFFGFTQQVSYDIIINLDDRILAENQIERDIEIIKLAFDDWKSAVRKKMYVTSNDCFRLLLTPQESTPYEVKKIASTMSIDLSKCDKRSKRKAVDAFSKNFDSKLAQLYILAKHSDSKHDYSGANIWNYLNGIYQDEKKPANSYSTNLILLSDGYIDFEGKPAVFTKAKKFSDTSFLNSIRDIDWESHLSQTGLLPCNVDLSNTSVFIYELGSKVNFPYETQMLKKMYNDWFNAMGADKVKSKGKTSSMDFISCLTD